MKLKKYMIKIFNYCKLLENLYVIIIELYCWFMLFLCVRF